MAAANGQLIKTGKRERERKEERRGLKASARREYRAIL